mmetsp:Transcript_41266/g.76787  ORF Transcript_41266/g.76787 Transcript_41266/m.76787 type:complete len:214 (+) Transcript_41266:845-1486(+)
MSTWRISVLTLFKGCRCPPVQGTPLTLVRLKGLKVMLLQLPLMIISDVKSATAFWEAAENLSVFSTEKAVKLVGAMSFRFFSASNWALPRELRDCSSFCVPSSTVSTDNVQTLVALSIDTHLFFMHVPMPILAIAPSAASTSALATEPLDLMKLKTWNSGLPFLQYCSPSSVSFQPSRLMGCAVTCSSAWRDLIAPTSTSWSQPFSWQRASES